MAKTYETLVNRFDGGMATDIRTADTRKFGITKHFDAFTYPHKLVPYYKTEAVEDKTLDIVKFLYAESAVGGSFRFYGLGVVTGTTKAKFYYLDNATWTAVTGGESSSANRSEDVFFEYKGGIFAWRSGNLMRHDISGASFNDSYQTFSWTNVAQPVHHPSDDIAYFFYDNKVASLNDTVWTTAALTLPDDLKITCATPFGNYLAIGCVSLKDTNKNSIVYLWDRDSSIATLTERIDFGSGELVHLANLNNKLIGVMNFYLNDSNGLDRGKMIVKQASGTFAVSINEIIADDSVASPFPATRVIQDNKLYFPATVPLASDSNDRMGIWVIDSEGRISLDFVVGEATSYQGIFLLGNTWWVAHSNDGSVNRTDDNQSYDSTEPGIYESIRFNNGDSSKVKKLVGVSVMTEPLPTALATTAVVLKYRKNEETSWTTIFTEQTDNSISHSSVNIESSKANLPEYKEIEFRIESIGGAVITGFRFKAEETDKNPY